MGTEAFAVSACSLDPTFDYDNIKLTPRELPVNTWRKR
jgi:hypothetical protein